MSSPSYVPALRYIDVMSVGFHASYGQMDKRGRHSWAELGLHAEYRWFVDDEGYGAAVITLCASSSQLVATQPRPGQYGLN